MGILDNQVQVLIASFGKNLTAIPINFINTQKLISLFNVCMLFYISFRGSGMGFDIPDNSRLKYNSSVVIIAGTGMHSDKSAGYGIIPTSFTSCIFP